MADLEYSKRMGDRREGRLLRSLSGYQRMAPLALRRRSEAVYSIADSVEVTAMEQWLRAKRAEGWAGLGFVHLLIAAYVRTVSMRPAVNRFISGQRIYARNDIQAVLSVKRSASSSAAETCVKVSFSPTDTVFDVYRRLSEAVDAVKADVATSEPERISERLTRLPRFLVPAPSPCWTWAPWASSRRSAPCPTRGTWPAPFPSAPSGRSGSRTTPAPWPSGAMWTTASPATGASPTAITSPAPSSV